MKLRLLTILILLILPVLLMETIDAQTTAMMSTEVVTGTTTRVSLASDGAQGNFASFDHAISANGRYVAFYSVTDNLVSGDTNGHTDIFLRDTLIGQTSRVSVASDGTQGDGNSYSPAITADGRYVAFHSEATNLVPVDTNSLTDIFLHDTLTGQTSRVSVAFDGTEANGYSYTPAISSDARYITFNSAASNLVSNDTNGWNDVFIYDTLTDQISRVSIASDGTQGNSVSYESDISGDGRYVVFYSGARNLVPDDTNFRCDVFLHDTQTSQTSRISVASDGTQYSRCICIFIGVWLIITSAALIILDDCHSRPESAPLSHADHGCKPGKLSLVGM